MNAHLSSLTATRPLEARLEQIIERAIGDLEDGAAIDVEALAAAHPEFSDQLRKLLPMVAALVGMGGAGVDPDEFATPTNGDALAPPYRQLGDFRLIREIGRGGMGTVFEAEQVTMGRRVALKVLPFAALAHEKSLQRFRNEVRAAAALDHPNIVSVYSIGEERGIHYFAMQLIRGQTLAEYIAGLKASRGAGTLAQQGSAPSASADDNPRIDSASAAPSTIAVEQARISTVVDSRRTAEQFRTAARLGIQAADALQHAHDQGVLHRDIKPGNLMLDGAGKLYITDFGLARIEADAGLTMTGDIIGTLRYMAPEQALAKRVVVDHRADVYSLGAMLYELVALEPAFGETDRSELLKQIAFEEPRPLRKLDKNIPVELETIVLKAMAKNREERYQSAQRLADDILAFLENRPIKARPQTLVNRAAKWSRRHRPLVGSAALSAAMLLVMGVVFLMVSNSRIRKESAAKALAIAEKDAALVKAREAVDQMLTRVADETLFNVPRADPLRNALYEDALRFYEGFLRQAESDPSLRLETANAFNRVSYMQREMGRSADARRSQERCVELLQSLVDSDPSDLTYREHLAEAVGNLGYIVYSDPAKTTNEEAEVFYRDALQLYSKLERDFPDRPQPSAGCLQILGTMADERGDLEAAEQFGRQALAQHKIYIKGSEKLRTGTDIEALWVRYWLAKILSMPGPHFRPNEAEKLLSEVVDIADNRLKLDPKLKAQRYARATALWRLGILYRDTHRIDQGIPFFRETLAEYQTLVERFPWDDVLWSQTQSAMKSLDGTLSSAKLARDLKQSLRDQYDWLKRIAPGIPNDPVAQAGLLQTQFCVIEQLRLEGPSTEADELAQAANELQARIEPQSSHDSVD